MRKALVVTFPTKLVSPVLEFKQESYCISGFAVFVCFAQAGESDYPVHADSEYPILKDCSISAKDFKSNAYWSFSEYPIKVDSDYPILKNCSNSAKGF